MSSLGDQPAPDPQRARPYAMTGGRTRPTHDDLETETLISTTSVRGADAEADRGPAGHRRPLPRHPVHRRGVGPPPPSPGRHPRSWSVRGPRSTWSSSTGQPTSATVPTWPCWNGCCTASAPADKDSGPAEPPVLRHIGTRRWRRTRPVKCQVGSGVGARARSPSAGLAAQPLPHRPDRGRTRLRLRFGRAARLRERRRQPAGHDLAVAAQRLHPPRPRLAGPQPQAVRQRAIGAARQRTGQPGTPSLDPMFVALNAGALPARERSPAGLHEWVRREEQYATLGANVVVELYSESHARRSTTRAWAIVRRADRAHRHTSDH